jgi:hypothetical protein
VGRLRSHGSVGGLQNDSEGVWELVEERSRSSFRTT